MKQVQMFLFLLPLQTGEQMDLNPCMLLTSSFIKRLTIYKVISSRMM